MPKYDLITNNFLFSYFQGEWVSGVREGQGIILYRGGNIYEGEWRGDQRHGRGRYTHTAQGYLQEGWWHSDQLKCSLCSKIDVDSSTTCLPPLGLEDYQTLLKEQKSKIFNQKKE